MLGRLQSLKTKTSERVCNEIRRILVQYISIVKKKVALMDEKLEEAKQEVDYYKRRFEESVGRTDLAKTGEAAAGRREHHEHEIWDHHHSKPRIDRHLGEETIENP